VARIVNTPVVFWPLSEAKKAAILDIFTEIKYK
jgi:hypothetical protein